MTVNFNDSPVHQFESTDTILLDALHQIPFAALLIRPDRDLTVLWRNEAHALMSASTGRPVKGQPLFVAFPPSDEAEGAAAKRAVHECVDRILVTHQPEDLEPYRYDLRDEGGAFIEHHWHMHMSPVVQEGKVVAVLQVAQDVTAAVLKEQLAASLRRAAHSTANLSYFSFDPKSDRFDRSPEVDELFGFAPSEASDKAASFFARIHPDDLQAVEAELRRVFEALPGEVAAFDYRILLPDEPQRFVRVRGEVVTDPTDRVQKLVGTFVDVTDIEENRNALAKSLELRDALVKEANHRIKNSLAISLGMLRLQHRSLARQDCFQRDDALDALKSVEGRIRAVADVHGIMELAGNETQVSLRSLMSRLVSFTRDSAGVNEAEFEYNEPDIDVTLDSDTAVSLGLVLNEVITNALKYGVEQHGPTRMVLDVSLSDRQLQLKMRNGIAAKQRDGEIPSTQLGSQLVAQIAAQLGAELMAEASGGEYHFALTMPLSQDTKDNILR